jgi:hypothetical protein
MIGRFLDWLLGPKCAFCDERVFPDDVIAHQRLEHTRTTTMRQRP